MSDYQHLANNAIIKPHIILISFAHISLFCCCLLLLPFVSRCSGSCNCLVWFNNVFCGFAAIVFIQLVCPFPGSLSSSHQASIYMYIFFLLFLWAFDVSVLCKNCKNLISKYTDFSRWFIHLWDWNIMLHFLWLYGLLFPPIFFLNSKLP